MIRINQKQKQFLELLLNQYDFKPISYFADILHVSSRSIHNYILVINEYICPMNLSVETKQGTGIQLVGNTNERMEVLNTLYKQKNEIEEYTTVRRQNIIARMLIFEEQVVTHQKLADMFYVSTTSISKDLNKIASCFDDSTAHIESSKKGTALVGNELQKQRTMILYMECLLQQNQIFVEDIYMTKGIDFLKEYFDKKVIACAYQNLQKIQDIYHVVIPEKYRNSLLMMMLIFLTRLLKDKHPVISRNFIFEEIKNLDTYFIAEELLILCRKQLPITYQESDIDYFNKQLIAHSIQLSYQENEEEKKYTDVVKQLISIMSDVLEVNLRDDEVLYKNVIMHFVPMLYRLKMNITIKNPILNEIREQYSIVFSGMWYAMSTIETMLDVKITDDEISFLAVHFQIAVERNYNGKKILIVCPNGIGISELIFNKIKKIIPSQDTIEITTSKQLSTNDLSQIDFIITAIDLYIPKVPIIKVSSLVNNNDIRNITNMYTDLFYRNTEKIDKEYNFTKVNALIDKDYIFLDRDFTTREQCLSFLTTVLTKGNIVDAYFQESVFSREEQGETDLSSGVALPHASPVHVLNSKLAILTLKNKILWQSQKVDVVLLLCLSKKDSQQVKSILSEVYTLIKSSESVEYYFSKKTKEEILHFFKTKEELGEVIK
ncbi:MAG: BglG family transcription antiterminator [Coprobacillaceae bacterium]